MSWFHFQSDDEDRNLYASSSIVETNSSETALLNRVGQPVDPRIMYAWERNRILFNVVLVTWTLMLALLLNGPAAFINLLFWECAIAGACAVNFCYCAGSVVEFYLTLLGLPIQIVRKSVFLLGTLVGMLLAAVGVLFVFLRF